MVPKMTVFLIFSTCSTARIHPWRHFFPEHPIIIYLEIPIMTLFYLSFQVLFFVVVGCSTYIFVLSSNSSGLSCVLTGMFSCM